MMGNHWSVESKKIISELGCLQSSGCLWIDVGRTGVEQGSRLGGDYSGPGDHAGLNAAGWHRVRVGRAQTVLHWLPWLSAPGSSLLDHEPSLPQMCQALSHG